MAEVHQDQPNRRPEKVTAAGQEYFAATEKAMALFHLVIDSVVWSDYVVHIAKQALADDDIAAESGSGPAEVPKVTPGELARKDPGPRTRALRRARQELLEVFLSHAVDGFQSYVAAVVRMVLQRRPEAMNDSDLKLTMQEILSYATKEDLIAALVDRKVNDLAYGGFAELRRWCEKREIPLIVSPSELPRIVELIATRNVIAHNRGIVDHRYLTIVPNSKFQLRERRKLDVDEFLGAVDLLDRMVAASDAAVAAKFELPRISYVGAS